MIDPAKTQSFTAGSDDKILQDLASPTSASRGTSSPSARRRSRSPRKGCAPPRSSTSPSAPASPASSATSARPASSTRVSYGEKFGAQASITNGTPSNTNDDSDRLFSAARFDFKPTQGDGPRRVRRHRQPGDDRPARATASAPTSAGTAPRTLPLLLRAEYGTATDGQANGTDDRPRRLLRLGPLHLRQAVPVRRSATRSTTRTRTSTATSSTIVTGGFHYLIKGKNINLKAEWYGDRAGRAARSTTCSTRSTTSSSSPPRSPSRLPIPES